MSDGWEAWPEPSEHDHDHAAEADNGETEISHPHDKPHTHAHSHPHAHEKANKRAQFVTETAKNGAKVKVNEVDGGSEEDIPSPPKRAKTVV